MKKVRQLMRTGLNLTALVLLAVIPCVGQETNQGKKAIVTVDIPPSSYKKVGQAEISYFSESNAIEVRIEISPYRNRLQSANMFFVFNAKGRQVVQPSFVSIGMAFFTDKQTAEKLQDFAIEIDGKRIQLDNLTKSGVGYDYNAKNSFKDMKGTIPYAIFEQLANSKVIKVYVDGVVFEFDKKNREALADMLKAIGT